jgi:hypothetical protein
VAEGLEFVKIVDDDYFGGDAVDWGGSASAQRGENDFLRGAGGLSWIFGELRGPSVGL